jgi:hypothetical protein
MSTLTVSDAQPAVHLPTITPTDRRARGKRLRDRVPRADHDKWRASSDRADPIDILRAADATRQQDLMPLRYGRMLPSPFTFYRGSAGIMAADLARMQVSGIHVQACGDYHLLNFGGFATPERRLILDINDLTRPCRLPGNGTSSVSSPRLCWPLVRTGSPMPMVATQQSLARAAIAERSAILPPWMCSTSGTLGSRTATSSRCCRSSTRQGCKKDREGDGRQQFGAGVPKAGRGR